MLLCYLLGSGDYCIHRPFLVGALRVLFNTADRGTCSYKVPKKDKKLIDGKNNCSFRSNENVWILNFDVLNV